MEESEIQACALFQNLISGDISNIKLLLIYTNQTSNNYEYTTHRSFRSGNAVRETISYKKLNELARTTLQG
jgi:hypothetical protein